MDALGVAVAGTGFIGPVHVEALRRAGQNVVGILGSTPAKSAEAAGKLGLATGYESFDEILTSKGRRLSFEQAESRLDRHCRNCPYFGACPGSFVADSSPQQQKQLEESGCSV